MPIPDFETILRPFLAHLSDGRDHSIQETLDALAAKFSLTDEERRQLLPSGRQPRFSNRVAWARFYLKKAGAVESPRRGSYRILPRGVELLKSAAQIEVETLQQFPEFREFVLKSRQAENSVGSDKDLPAPDKGRGKGPGTELTPEESLAAAHSRLVGQLAADLLDRIKQSPPEFFERLVVDLLLALNYGGSRRDAGRTVGRSGDGGIDGVINEDRLGLDVIYIQAKRWENTVGRPELQKFAGALQGQRAKKGIFIITSNFSRDARDFVAGIDNKIVLLDGEQVARLMIDHNVGVTTEATYEVKKIDSDYFAED